MYSTSEEDVECESLPEDPLLFDDIPTARYHLCHDHDECKGIIAEKREISSAYQTPRASEPRDKKSPAHFESNFKEFLASPLSAQLDTNSTWNEGNADANFNNITRADAPLFECAVPERANITWVVRDFHSFRAACAKAELPPLRSPELTSRGIRGHLYPYHKGGNIALEFSIPECLSFQATTYCLTITLLSTLSQRRKNSKV